jgi:hypothetical protein
MATTDLSPAGSAAMNLSGSAETEAERKKRLAAIQNSRAQIGAALGGDMSPAAAAYLNFGGLGL